MLFLMMLGTWLVFRLQALLCHLLFASSIYYNVFAAL